MKLRDIAMRNIGRNRRRSMLSGVAIGVAAMSIVLLFALIDGMAEDLSNNLHDFYSGMVRVRHVDYDANELLSPLHLRVQDASRRSDELLTLDGVQSVSPRVAFPASVYLDGETHNAQGVGVDMELERSYSRIDEYLLAGGMPSPGEREVLLGGELADELGIGVGDQLTLLTLTMRRSSNAVTYTVAGTLQLPVNMLNNNVIYVPLASARQLIRMDDAATEILIKLDDERASNAFAAALRERWLEEDLRIASWREIQSSYSFVELARSIYNGMAVVFFLLGSTVIITTTMIVIFERMREIGTIAAMGMTRRQIVQLFFLEALFIAIIAAAVGVVVGTGITLVLGEVGISMGEALDGVDVELGTRIFPRWRFETALFVFAYSVVVTALASYFPSRKAARVEPVEALHTV